MAGRIRKSDIDEVRTRTNIADIVGDHVALKPAGVGSLKGLCPFHDERSPSFHVRPAVGRYHCFGCGEDGDVYTFLQKLDHATFAEAVERLAGRIGYTLHYEDGGPAASESGNRARLLAANRAAGEFFVERLASPDADAGRRFLGERGFDRAAAAHFGVGFAPKSWDELTKHLRGRGFTNEELSAAGLVSSGDRGPYDRFRGRVVWPIRDLTGETVGFGARRLFDDDKGPKYLNTPETPIYHKSQVLYGLDLAKRDMSRARQVVVVEGYTDVMACHLAGITTAVATCGTSFGVEHIKIIRRVLGDDSGLGEVVFTFDPDAAGQKAAVRAFAEEQRFAAQTYVATGPEGLDPCDLRLARGDEAVRGMIDSKKPMFEFMIKQQLAAHDLDTVEGRVGALRAAAPIVAGIRDPSLRPGYSRELARWLGMELGEVSRAVSSAASRPAPVERDEAPPRLSGGEPAAEPAPRPQGPTLAQLPTDASTRLERDALMGMIQHPALVGDALLERATKTGFGNRALAAVRDAVGANIATASSPEWLDTLADAVPEVLVGLARELSIAPLPQTRGEELLRVYVRDLASRLVDRDLQRRKRDLLAQLQRTGSGEDPERYRAVQQSLVELEAERRSLSQL
ncbi:DNA primase [Herbiconiux sp. L3-i23]|uniref:DNA primase n=1 Tax=Herbiconiux sp. L3-i23 TaxID=2905871 RepID=UPI00204862CD|nr:DNA primase [Herbiconiux sp. L3-i23]BDI23032.1 DNA primase [Herbiconiux sp. L3-i23]